MRVEVIYASTARTWLRYELDLTEGTTVSGALAASGLLARFPEINWSSGFGLAIYGVAADLAQPLKEGDRLEIVRPLAAEPKEARRRRVRKARPISNRP